MITSVNLSLSPIVPFTKVLKDKLTLVLSPVTIGTECLVLEGNKIIVPFFTGIRHELELKTLYSSIGKSS